MSNTVQLLRLNEISLAPTDVFNKEVVKNEKDERTWEVDDLVRTACNSYCSESPACTGRTHMSKDDVKALISSAKTAGN